MTREEAIQYARYVRNKTKDCPVIVLHAEVIDAILSTPWHKTSEELPKEKHYMEKTLQGVREWKESEPVLVINTLHQKTVDMLINGQWAKLCLNPKDCDGFPIEYLYWMEIPELPKED